MLLARHQQQSSCRTQSWIVAKWRKQAFEEVRGALNVVVEQDGDVAVSRCDATVARHREAQVAPSARTRASVKVSRTLSGVPSVEPLSQTMTV